jgi:hypothetical protein
MPPIPAPFMRSWICEAEASERRLKSQLQTFALAARPTLSGPFLHLDRAAPSTALANRSRVSVGIDPTLIARSDEMRIGERQT